MQVGIFALGAYVIGALLFPNVFKTLGTLLYVQEGVLSNIQLNFTQKKNIVAENAFLKLQLDTLEAQKKNAQTNQQFAQNLYKATNTVGGAVVTTEVLMRPPFATYDTYIIAAGSNNGVEKNQLVVASGVYVVGYVDAVVDTYSRVRLFSSAGHTQTLSIDGFLFQSTGLGGGAISTRLPRNFADTSGQLVSIPGASNLIAGIVSVTEFDPQDSYVTGIVTPGVNTYTQELVTVLKQKWVDTEALDLEQFNNADNEEDTDSL